jgi:Spy/CpxP family protein refolding chaperone
MKMKKMPSLRIVRLLSILALLAIFVLASGCSCGRSHSIENRATRITDRTSKELDLSESQKTELNQIKDEIIKKFKSKESVERRREIRTALSAMIKEDSLTKEKLMALHQKQEEGQKEMRELLMDKFIQFHKVLTPDQRMKLTTLFEKFAMKIEE